jgi:hypothetical protein
MTPRRGIQRPRQKGCPAVGRGLTFPQRHRGRDFDPMKKSIVSKVASNVVRLPTAKAAKLRSEAKWGRQAMDQGFCILPSLLFRAQSRLGLKSTHLVLVLQLAEFWWYDENLPWPKKETVAQRMGLKEKQVQRIARALEQRGYITRRTRMTPHGQTSNAYDLSGLVRKLAELAPEFAAVAAAKRQVERRGGLKSRTTALG